MRAPPGVVFTVRHAWQRAARAPETFLLPVDRLRAGYYSDAYFVLTKQLLEDAGHHPRVRKHPLWPERRSTPMSWSRAA